LQFANRIQAIADLELGFEDSERRFSAYLEVQARLSGLGDRLFDRLPDSAFSRGIKHG